MSDTGISCVRGGCPGQGTWVPLMVFQSGENRKDVVASIPEIMICESHKSESTLESFLSPEGWTKIEKFLRENGKGNFQRRRAKLEWKRNQNEGLLPF